MKFGIINVILITIGNFLPSSSSSMHFQLKPQREEGLKCHYHCDKCRKHLQPPARPVIIGWRNFNFDFQVKLHHCGFKLEKSFIICPKWVEASTDHLIQMLVKCFQTTKKNNRKDEGTVPWGQFLIWLGPIWLIKFAANISFSINPSPWPWWCWWSLTSSCKKKNKYKRRWFDQ